MRQRSRTGWRCTIGVRLLALCTLAVLAAGYRTLLADEPSSGGKANTLATVGTGKPAQTPALTDSDGRVPNVVLYDQTTSLGPGTTSQNFEAINDAFDNQGADDFLTTGAGWSITKVVVPGTYSAGGGPAPSVGVQFYSNNVNVPGTLLCNYPALPIVDAPAGTFSITLPAPCNIPGGTRAWVSVFANMSASTNGQWFWATRTILTGSYAAWQNPGNGLGTGCATWIRREACLGSSAPDQGFRLEGDPLPCTVNSDCNDINPCTDEVCQAGGACAYTNNTAPCEDGNGCTTSDVCSGGVCQSGPYVQCEDDGLFCTVDVCFPNPGHCVSRPRCEVNDSCTFGTCDEATDTCSFYRPPLVEFCDTGAVTVPLTAGPGSPYPATIAVTGLPASSKLCTVRLNNITHTWSDDLDILLSGPASNTVVMSDVGGGVPVTNASVLLTDGAANFMPDGPTLVSGTYRPTNLGLGEGFAPPAPSTTGSYSLSVFGSGDQNGSWNLWVQDDSAQDGGSIAGGWCIGFSPATCANDSECSDGIPCNGTETCVSSRCEPGTPINCEDGLFCTNNWCDTGTGTCHIAPRCDDGNPCTTDTCVETVESCAYTNNTNACDDGRVCSIDDKCADGTCNGTPRCAEFCSTDPISIPEEGASTPYPSVVVSAVLYPAYVVSVSLNGFSHQFPDDVDILLVGPVDDSQNIIVMSDAGGGGGVVDINLTFTDTAETAISNTGPLASGTFRPANYDGGTDPDPFPAPAPGWSGSTALSTFNGNPNGTFELYVFDEFGPDGGSIDQWCVKILYIGCTDDSVCDDGNFCTADACVDGGCRNVFSTAVCDDSNPCTIETCSQQDGCGNVPNTCDDNNACTTDSCTDFVGCNNPTTAICNDGDPSTDDTCDPATGTCVFGDCDDGDPCTIDTVDPGTLQCVYAAILCDDGVYCNGAETCSGGVCIAGSPVNCDDGNPCTDDVCTGGSCVYPNNTAPCGGGSSCGTCEGGVCVATSSQPNPKTKGFYKKACKRNELTEAEAQCVAQTAPMTFGDVVTVAEVCDEINGHDSDLPGHDTDEKHCTKDESELLVLALNICTGRLCESQPINSHDSDASNDPDPATVGEAVDEADAIFGDPDRTKETCHDGKDLVKDINNGKALENNSLRLNEVSNGVMLVWNPPFTGENQSIIKYEVWRTIRGSEAPPTRIYYGPNTGFVDTAVGDFDYEVIAEIQD